MSEHTTSRGRTGHARSTGETIGLFPEEGLIQKFQAGELDASTVVRSTEPDEWKEAPQDTLRQRYVPSSGDADRPGDGMKQACDEDRPRGSAREEPRT